MYLSKVMGVRYVYKLQLFTYSCKSDPENVFHAYNLSIRCFNIISKGYYHNFTHYKLHSKPISCVIKNCSLCKRIPVYGTFFVFVFIFKHAKAGSIWSLHLTRVAGTNPQRSHQAAFACCFTRISRGTSMGRTLGGATDLVLSNRIWRRADTDLL